MRQSFLKNYSILKQFLLILTVVLVSCSSDDESRLTNSDLIGKWNWTNTDGGIGFHIHETPSSTGKTIELHIKDNNRYLITENGNIVSSGSYQISMKNSIYSSGMDRCITYSTDSLYQNHNVVFGGIILLENKILTIADNNYDGVTSKYVH